MRKCLRCNEEMIENIEVKTNDAMGISIGEKGIFKPSLGKVIAAICPECGYTELYIDDLKKVKEVSKKQDKPL